MKYFGTDGIRGIVNNNLTIELLQSIGRALKCLNIETIYIGYDPKNKPDRLITFIEEDIPEVKAEESRKRIGF